MANEETADKISVREVANVFERAKALGLNSSVGVTILPSGFFDAEDASKLSYVQVTPDVKILLRRAGIALDAIETPQTRIPFRAQYDNTWLGPVIFFGAAYWSQNSELVSVALNTISNYLTDWFKGVSGEPRVKLGVVIEESNSKKTTRIQYDGPLEGLKGIEKLVKDAMK